MNTPPPAQTIQVAWIPRRSVKADGTSTPKDSIHPTDSTMETLETRIKATSPATPTPDWVTVLNQRQADNPDDDTGRLIPRRPKSSLST